MKTRISKILYDKGWTEMELSRRTGLAQSYINRVKNSRIVPTVRTARNRLVWRVGLLEVMVCSVFVVFL